MLLPTFWKTSIIPIVRNELICVHVTSFIAGELGHMEVNRVDHGRVLSLFCVSDTVLGLWGKPKINQTEPMNKGFIHSKGHE